MPRKDRKSRQQYYKDYHQKNKKKRQDASRKYHNNNKEARNAKSREYYRTHKEERQEYNKKYREENREELINSSGKYRAANPDAWKNWYEKNKEKVDKKRKIYRSRPSVKKRQRESNIAWKKEHPDYWKDWEAQYNAANPDKYQAKLRNHRRYMRENKDKCDAYRANRKCLKTSSVLSDTNQKKITKIYRQRNKIQEKTGESYHVDHIIPLSIGGAHHQDNLRVVTASDNLKKKDKYVPELGGVWANNKLARKTKKKLDIE